MLDKEAFSTRLRQAIGVRKQREVAKAAGIPPPQLSKYLHGQFPSVDVLGRLTATLSCSTDWLLTGRFFQDDLHDKAKGNIAYLAAVLTDESPDVMQLFGYWGACDKKKKATLLRIAFAICNAKLRVRICIEEFSRVLERDIRRVVAESVVPPPMSGPRSTRP